MYIVENEKLQKTIFNPVFVTVTENSICCLIEMRIYKKMTVEPVSYTHLDVYKRQT